MFKTTSGKGFQMTFANGWTVSVQFGAWNYCDNYNLGLKPGYLESIKEGKYPDHSCDNAEIAAWDRNKVWYNFGNDGVKGHCSADEVAVFIALIAGKTS